MDMDMGASVCCLIRIGCRARASAQARVLMHIAVGSIVNALETQASVSLTLIIISMLQTYMHTHAYLEL